MSGSMACGLAAANELLTAEISRLKEERERAEEQISDLHAEISRQKLEFERAALQITGLNSDLNYLRERRRELLEENSVLNARVDRLRAERMCTISHETNLSFRVRGFMKNIGSGHEVLATPQVPNEATVKLRLRLVVEEVLELLHASGVPLDDGAMDVIYSAIDHYELTPQVDMVELADALGDIDYVVEGMRLAFGINGRPIAEEIHRTNMQKLDGPRDEHGKILKPPGWKPPRIREELLKQGWKP